MSLSVYNFSDNLVVRFKQWLSPEGIRYFQLLKHFHGRVDPILRLNYKRKGLPVHPVHLRDGIPIRNWMRQQPELKPESGYNAMLISDGWTALVELAIQK